MIRTRAGFTLIEILVVIAIIAVLTALLLPVLAKARDKVRQSTCISNQHQLCLGITMALDGNDFWGDIGSTDPQVWLGEVRQYIKPGKVWLCPNNTNATDTDGLDYGFNTYLYGLPVGSITEPSRVVMLADAAAPLLTATTDVALRRHGKGYITSFVDGHQEYLDPSKPEQMVIYGPGEMGTLLSFGAEHVTVEYSTSMSATGTTEAVREGTVVVVKNTAKSRITAAVASGGNYPLPTQGFNPQTADLTIKPGLAKAFALYCRVNPSTNEPEETTFTFGVMPAAVTLTVQVPPKDIVTME